jgi:trk system potassium uptake protein TrkA
MTVVVFGVGGIAFFLVKKLLYEHEVIVVALEGEDVSRFEDIGASVFFVRSISPKSIKSLNVMGAEVCISLFPNDETNIITCQLMCEMFQTKVRIAKIKNEFYLEDRGFLQNRKDGFVSLVGNFFSVEEEVSEVLIEGLEFVAGMDFRSMVNDTFVLIGVNVTKKVDNLINRLKSSGCSVLGVTRESAFLSVDRVEEVEVDDTIYLVIKKAEMEEVLGGVFDAYSNVGNRSVIIIGGGSMGLSIAKKLQNKGLFKHVKIIEKHLSRAKELFENVEGIEIINGDALDQGVIIDANIQEADLLIGATTYCDTSN